MGFNIKERKVNQNGDLVGYLLDQDGLELVVNMRDLYEGTIVDGLIAAGYKYHDYYGDITNEAGISISELSSSVLTDDDNTAFMGAFEDSVLTEQQMLQYFSINMDNIKVFEFHAPIEIRIKTREELMRHLEMFKNIDNSPIPLAYVLLPINAITAPEALFTIEELEADNNLVNYMSLINTRRTWCSQKHLDRTKDALIKAGVLREEDKNDISSFIQAWSAFGPEGLNAKCIDAQMQRDVVYKIDERYSGSNSEQLTFASIAPQLRQKVTDDVLARCKTRFGYGLLDKQGVIHFEGQKISPVDIVSNAGDILLTDSDQQKWNKLRREVANWTTEFAIIPCRQIVHMDRVCLTLQLETGQLYQWRMDQDDVVLVSTHSKVFTGRFGAIRLFDGKCVHFDVGFRKNANVEVALFRYAVKQYIRDNTVPSLFKSTVDMCTKAGLNMEQALDYVQAMKGLPEAAQLLHDGLPPEFITVFGEGLDQLEEDATLFDRLDLLLSNYIELTDPSNENFFDIAKLTSSLGSLGTVEGKCALFCLQNKIDKVINAVLTFSDTVCAGEQANGRIRDSKEFTISAYASLISTLYKLKYDEFSIGNLNTLLNETFNDKYFDLKKSVGNLASEYVGSLDDFGNLALKQLTDASISVFATGVVSEVSALPAEERRHLGFFGWQMHIQKGTKMRNIINGLMMRIENQTKEQTFYLGHSDEIRCTRYFYSKILSFLWGLRTKSISFKTDSNNDVYIEVSVKDTFGDKHIIKLSVTTPEYNHIINPGNHEFEPFYTSLYDWNRNSMSMFAGTLKFYAVSENVTVDPWYVNLKHGYNDLIVYSGAVNLIPEYSWENVYKVKRQDLYERVRQQNARFATSIVDLEQASRLFDNTGNISIDKAIFKEENKRLGVDGDNIPATMRDYYLDDPAKMESISNYYRRVTLSSQEASKAGKTFVQAPLKSDVYYDAAAIFYGYDTSDEILTAESGKYGKPTDDVAPVTLKENRRNMIEQGGAKVSVFSDADISAFDLANCIDLIAGTYESSKLCYIGATSIIIEKVVTKFADVDSKFMEQMVADGMAYRINGVTYLVYAVNGTFIVEV